MDCRIKEETFEKLLKEYDLDAEYLCVLKILYFDFGFNINLAVLDKKFFENGAKKRFKKFLEILKEYEPYLKAFVNIARDVEEGTLKLEDKLIEDYKVLADELRFYVPRIHIFLNNFISDPERSEKLLESIECFFKATATFVGKYIMRDEGTHRKTKHLEVYG